MLQTSSEYTTRCYRPEDEPAVLELLKLSLGESAVLPRTPALWRWKHQTSPFGPSYVRVACTEDGCIVGVRAFMRWEFQIGGRNIRAVRAVDTATHPDYQRRGIFASLTSQVVNDVSRDGADLIFNTPNFYSLPGYLKLGWQRVAKVQLMIRVMNFSRFALGLAMYGLGRQPESSELGQVAFFRVEPTPVAALLERRDVVEKLLEQDWTVSRQSNHIVTTRTWEYLRWRYADHPTIPYWAMTIEDGSGLRGVAICRTNIRFGLKEIILCELLLRQTGQDAGRELLDRLRTSVKADYLIAHFSSGSAYRRLLKNNGFRIVPRQGIEFTARILADDLPRDPLCFDSWALTMGDLELF